MKNKLLITVLVLISTWSHIYASPKQLRKIRKLYNWAQSADLQKNKIICNTIMPAIGLQTTTITFYHTSAQVNPERDPYLMKYFLHKVVVSYNIAASASFEITYLYDRQKRVVFYYKKSNTMTQQKLGKRLYFHANRLFRVHTTKNGKHTIRSRKFNKSDHKSARSVLKKANLYYAIFHTLLKSEQIDK